MSNTPYADLLSAIRALQPTNARTLIPYMETTFDVGQLETREMIQLAFERGAIALDRGMLISLSVPDAGRAALEREQ